MAASPGPPLGSSRKMDGGQPPSNEEEPPKDPGLAKHHSYTIEDLEGHHAHSIYTGIHIPGAYRRRSRHRHHRHHHHHKSSKDGTENRPGEFLEKLSFVSFIIFWYQLVLGHQHKCYSALQEY